MSRSVFIFHYVLECTMPSAHAAADMFVLLSWCCGLYVTCLECSPDFPSNRAWPVLLGIMASLVDMVLDPSTRAKKSLQKSALVRTRRALRHVSRLKFAVGHANTCQRAQKLYPLL